MENEHMDNNNSFEQSSSSSSPPLPAPSSLPSSSPPPLLATNVTSSSTTASSSSSPVKNASVDMLSPSSLLSSTSSLCSQEINSALSITECSFKLRHLMDRLRDEKDGVNVEELMDGLRNAYLLLDVINNDEIRRAIITEQDEFSRVETDAVPPEVKDWLSMTFTQSNNSTAANRKSRATRAKFRSVANCIRAGIMVDKIYRRVANTSTVQVPTQILHYYKSIDEWSFQLLSMNEVSDGHILKLIGLEILQKFDLVNKFKINLQTLDNFLSRLEVGYGKHGNPYHNAVHAADVTQTVHGVLISTGLASWLTDLELLTVLTSCMIHDFEHTGTTNNYHINTASDIAIMYNDKSVLENYHLSATFRVMKDPEFNPFNNLKPDDYKEFRNLMIEIVLATDMSCHFQQIKNMKSLLSSSSENVDRAKAFSLIVHCADISHPAKPWSQHNKWTEFLIEEFFSQGDKELALGLPVSPLCDRNNTHVPESQIGFIDFIVDPSFQVMGDMIDKMLSDILQQHQSQQQSEPSPQQQQQQQQHSPTTTTTALSAPTTATITISATSTKTSTHKTSMKTPVITSVKHGARTSAATTTASTSNNNNNAVKHVSSRQQQQQHHHHNSNTNKLTTATTTLRSSKTSSTKSTTSSTTATTPSTTTSSTTSSTTTSTTTSKTASPSNQTETARIKRPWEECLTENKKKWKERANDGWICPQQAKPQ